MKHKDIARQSRNQNPSRELRESSVAAVYDRRRCRAHGSPAVIDRRHSRFRVIRGQQTCQKNKKFRTPELARSNGRIDEIRLSLNSRGAAEDSVAAAWLAELHNSTTAFSRGCPDAAPRLD